MDHADFHIGLEFVASAGFRWRCTDVGTRTILAIRLDRDDDPSWYQGPPYIAEETVFDEHELKNCHLTEDDAIRAALDEADASGHPGFPDEVVNHMMRARLDQAKPGYPHNGVLRFDRRTPDGEILHPYAARKDGDRWVMRLYLPFQRSYLEMPEHDFIALPVATAADLRMRADRSTAT
ncbi:hypothetical protein [Burkholderia cenocepacia]|uniref:hypothetical protein n=1 Tax=Burkholderia cenocepacia TaxID=95486 RepID=UPI000846327F|nr:hypothetical protein [Burkholderia cenocepacia]